MTALAALAVAQERRMAIAELRAQVRRGELTLAQLMADPPDALTNWPCVDVVRLIWRSGNRSGASFERLGRLAVRDGVNLAMPLGRTSDATREWIAEHGVWHVHPNAGTPPGGLGSLRNLA